MSPSEEVEWGHEMEVLQHACTCVVNEAGCMHLPAGTQRKLRQHPDMPQSVLRHVINDKSSNGKH